MAEPISRARRLAYALGAPGWQLTDRIVVVVAFYFYLPPSGTDLVPQIPEGTFLGVLTAFGVANLIGRLADSLAEPLVGYASDHSRSRLGRRRTFLVCGLLPMVGVPVLLFWPPGTPGSALNAVWLSALLVVYFVSFTLYVAPYMALLPELAWDQESRVRLSSLLAVVALPIAGLFGVAWPLGLEAGRAAGLSGGDALRAVVVAASLLALVLCLFPILAIDEKRFSHALPSDLSFRDALRRTAENEAFRSYLCGQLLFALGMSVLGPALPYYATVILGRSEGFAAVIGLCVFVGVLVCFPFVGHVTARFGAKRSMISCVVAFGAAQSMVGLLRPDVPGGAHDAANLAVIFAVMTLSAAPVAGFMVLPSVLLSQVIDLDQVRTGAKRSAMYFGLQGVFTKPVFGFGAALLAFLFARFGKSPAEPDGVLLVGPVVGAACLLSALLFALYPEDALLAETTTHAGPRAQEPG